MKSVHHVRCEAVSVAEHKVLCPVENARSGGGQNIFAIEKCRVSKVSHEVAAKNGLFLAFRPIHSSDKLILISGGRNSKPDFAARICCSRQVLSSQGYCR